MANCNNGVTVKYKVNRRRVCKNFKTRTMWIHQATVKPLLYSIPGNAPSETTEMDALGK